MISDKLVVRHVGGEDTLKNYSKGETGKGSRKDKIAKNTKAKMWKRWLGQACGRYTLIRKRVASPWQVSSERTISQLSTVTPSFFLVPLCPSVPTSIEVRIPGNNQCFISASGTCLGFSPCLGWTVLSQLLRADVWVWQDCWIFFFFFWR